MNCGLFGGEVDHIRPRGIYFESEYDCMNLQILCRECNKKKSYISNKDYRTKDHMNKLNNAIEHNSIVRKYCNFKINGSSTQKIRARYLNNLRNEKKKRRIKYLSDEIAFNNYKERKRLKKLKKSPIEVKKIKVILRKRKNVEINNEK